MLVSAQKVETPFLISEESKAKIDVWVNKFPSDQKQSAVIPALWILQRENGGHVTKPIMMALAEYLEMPVVSVYEVASFYTMFELEPVGKIKVELCTNVSCMLCGSDDIADHLKRKLGIGFGQTSKDGKYTLKEVECLGACSGAPMMQIDDDYHENLTPERVDEILAKLEEAL